MPYVIALLGLIAGAWLWMSRARAAGMAAQDLAGMAQDVISAARRFGFRRRYDEHPVDSLQDADVAAAGRDGGALSTRQKEALEDIARAFRLG